jgi:putative ATP-binding cassette transporter
VQFFTVLYNYLTPVIPLLVVAPLYFEDQVTFDDTARSVGAFAAVVGALSVIIAQFQQIAQFAAGAEADLAADRDAYEQAMPFWQSYAGLKRYWEKRAA